MMLNFLFRDVPHISKHPIYTVEARRYRPPFREFDTFRRYSQKWLLHAFLWPMAFYALLYVTGRMEALMMARIWLVILSFFLPLVLDFTSILASVNLILKDRKNEHWNLITLTTLNRDEVITAKHLLAQMRVWRFTLVIIGLRCSLVVLELGINVWDSIYLGRNILATMFVDSVLIFLTICMGVVVYILEPLWRMRAVTGVGMMISARLRSLQMAILTGMGGLLLMWMGQGITMYLYAAFTATLTRNMWRGGLTADLMLTILLVMGLGLVIFGFYWLMRLLALRGAVHHAFEREMT